MNRIVYGILGLSILFPGVPVVAAPVPAPGPVMVAQAGVPDHIHHLWEGIRHLRHTHTILDAETGTNYGGFREQAEQQIDAALNDLSQAVEFYRTNVSHRPNPFPAPNLEMGGPGGGHNDHMGRLREGIRHLDTAKQILDGEAGTNYGGHREAAEAHITQAQGFLQQAVEYFRSNHRH